jgi:signal transduction histidine kinase
VGHVTAGVSTFFTPRKAGIGLKIQRQLIRLVLASLLPAALAAGLLIVYSYQRQRASIEHSTLDTARALTQAVDRELASGRTALQALATSPYLASGDLAAFHRQAREALTELPGNNVVVSDASGQQLVNTLSPFGEPLPRISHRGHLRLVFETGRPAISDLFVGELARRPLISVAVPVRRGGQVVYGISMAFFPDRLGEILRRQELPAGWMGAIFDSRGTIVARTHDADRFVGKQAVPAVVQGLAQLPEGRVEVVTLEGIPSVVVYSRSSVSNLSVGIAIPRAQFATELLTSIAWLIAGTVVLLASGLALARLLSARITRSIRGLIPPAAALGRGEPIVVPPLQLEEAQEVGRALVNAAKMLRDREEILAVVSHDLRNPLFSLMLNVRTAELMAAKLSGGEPLRAKLASLAEIGSRMSGMVDDLLAVAISTRGERSMLKIAPVNAASLLARAADAVRPLFAQEGIDLLIDSDAALPDVQVDPDRILRVFVNLLDNALKFTQRPGRVVLRAEEQPGAVQFSIANSGPALSAEELDNMFQPFWQARQDRRGAGLGLSICRSIVETHGGRIWGEPEPGMRVRVCFEVPRAPPAATKTR